MDVKLLYVAPAEAFAHNTATADHFVLLLENRICTREQCGRIQALKLSPCSGSGKSGASRTYDTGTVAATLLRMGLLAVAI